MRFQTAVPRTIPCSIGSFWKANPAQTQLTHLNGFQFALVLVSVWLVASLFYAPVADTGGGGGGVGGVRTPPLRSDDE